MAIPTSPTKWALKRDLDNYIYFSHITTGTSGRAVKIHKDVFLPFFCAVNPDTHEGQSVIRQIEQLRITPGHTSTGKNCSPTRAKILQKINDTFQYSISTKNIQLFYRLDQAAGDTSPVVYIYQIRTNHTDAQEAPGLYAKDTIYGSRNTSTTKMKGRSVDGKTVYINGLSDNVNSAMRDAEYETGSDMNLALFYTPATVCNDLGTWNSQENTYVTRLAVEELTEVLKHNQKASKGINWIIEGEGCAVLNNALKNFAGDLSNHNFKLINPKTNTPKLIENINKKKGALTGDFFNYSSSEAALIGMASHKEALIKQIGLLPGAKNYDKITRKNIVAQIGALAQVAAPILKQSAGLKSSHATFVDALKKAKAFRK